MFSKRTDTVGNRILVYDLDTSTMLLMNDEDAILVDISLCTGHAESKDWLTEKRTIVSVIGYVEREPIRVRQGRHGHVFY